MAIFQEVKEYEVLPGTTIKEAATEALRIATLYDCIVKFDFNDIKLRVSNCNDIDEIVSYYYKGLSEK